MRVGVGAGDIVLHYYFSDLEMLSMCVITGTKHSKYTKKQTQYNHNNSKFTNSSFIYFFLLARVFMSI